MKLKIFYTSSKIIMIFFVSIFSFSNLMKAANPSISVKLIPISANASPLVYRLYLKCSSSTKNKLYSANIYIDFDNTTLSYSSISFKDSFNHNGSGTIYGDSVYSAVGASNSAGNGGFQGNNLTYSTSFDELQVYLTGNSGSNYHGSPISSTGWSAICDITWTVNSGQSNATPVPFYFDENLPAYSAGSGGYNTPTPSYPTDDAGLQMPFGAGTASNFLFQDDATWNTTTTPAGLPITLINFYAILQNNETVLNWSTATEENNAYFTVERSQDGKNFEPIITKTGADNSGVKKEYTAYDENPLPGISYYRLRQTDYNGKSETFNIVAIDNTNMGMFAINYITPASASNISTLNYTMPADGVLRMVVTNLEGKIISDNLVSAYKGENSYHFDNANSWQPGMYIVSLVYHGKSITSKLIKN
jgi:hypothetical protein